MGEWFQQLGVWAKEKGCRVACGHPGVLDIVRAELDKRGLDGELNPEFCEKALPPFGYHAGSDPGWVRTVIVLSLPRPAHRVTFSPPGGQVQLIVPPTYQRYRPTASDIRAELAAGPLAGPVRLESLDAPLKAVSVRLGLVTYGRMNVTHAPEVGTYHQLIGFATDAPLPGDAATVLTAPFGTGPAPAGMSPECEGCFACQEACPTQAIDSDRFLLHAERCVTYHVEQPDPWPGWLPAAAHQCLVGCLACQQACPRNKGLLRLEDLEPAFTTAETERLLAEPTGPAKDTVDDLWRDIQAKLTELGLPGYEPILGRNLAAVLAARRAAA